MRTEIDAVDLTRTGKKLRTEIDEKIEGLENAGVRPTHILLDMPNYQLWCTFIAAQRAEDIADPWGDGTPDLQPELQYRDVEIIAVPVLRKLVSVSADMREVWQDLDAFVRAAA